MKNNQYYYAVTRIHTNEADMLTDQAIDRMRQADSYRDCLNVLKEHEWLADESMSAREVVDAQRDKVWSLLNELTDGSDLSNAFKLEHDFANLKAVIRLRHVNRMDEFGERYFSKYGALPQQTIMDSGAQGTFDWLPEPFSAPACEANRILLQTGNAQLSDAVLDRAYLESLRSEARKQGSSVLERYAAVKADIADVKTALRGLKMNNPADYFELAITGLGSLSKSELCSALSKDLDAVYAYLGSTAYAPYLDALKSSLSYFEAEAESRMIEAIKPQRYAIGGADPIFAFAIANENELNVVRLLLSSKINRFPNEFVAGCVRRMYA